MKLIALAVAAAAGAAVAEPYTLREGSTLTIRLCPPPCLCPGFDRTGPVTGTFTLTFKGSDPAYDNYDVSAIAWTAVVDGQVIPIQGSGTYRITRPVAMRHQLMLDLVVGSDPVRPYDSGLVFVHPHAFFPQIGINLPGEVVACTQNIFDLLAEPAPCYADCNADGVLNIADFGCFQSRYALQDPYADCNGDGVLNLADFGCFQTRFALGCP